MMNVLMAGCAIEARKVIGRYLCTGQRLMALVAGNGGMASSEWKGRLLMGGERVSRHLEGRTCVALFAAVPPRSACKLSLVFIRVAIDAAGKCDFELRGIACGNVTCGALNTRVRKNQRKTGLCVVGRRKPGRAPTVNRMTTFALPSICSMRELAAVRIGFVTVCTRIVRHRSLEVASLMAPFACDIEMFA